MITKLNCSDKSWRPYKPHKGVPGGDAVPATRFFDQLSYIGNSNVGCFLLETSEGIVLIDCMCPTEEHKNIIVKGIQDLGHDLSELKALLITHGHGDHYGCGDWFREQTGCTIYMSSVDTEFAKKDVDSPSGALLWDPDEFIEDGDMFELGGQKVYAFATPGHTPGCLSYIIPVTDCGVPHLTALWGGTGIPYYVADKALYLKSCAYFAEVTERMGVDSAIATHPFVDQSIKKLEIIREIVNGVPNPFVLGKEGYKQYERMFNQMCIDALEKQAPMVDKLLPERPKPGVRPGERKEG